MHDPNYKTEKSIQEVFIILLLSFIPLCGCQFILPQINKSHEKDSVTLLGIVSLGK